MVKTRILIVDDEAMIRNVVREYAEFEGFEAVEAGDGMEALSKISEERPNLIMLDVILPGKEKVTYIHVKPEMVPRIVTEHIVNGRPVEEYTIGAAKD